MSAEARDLVVFAYGYAASERDAVARVVNELAHELRSRGQRVAVIGIPSASIVASGGSPRSKVRRLRSEIAFLLATLKFVARKRRSIRLFVSIDVPSGLPFIGAFARLVGRGRIKDVAWVMDLYRLTRAEGGLGTTTFRASLELAALRASGAVVTIGSCMADTLEGLVGRSVGVVPLWHRTVRTQNLEVTQRPLRLLYSGSARDIHPLLALVETVAGRSDVHLRISGSGSEVQHVSAFLASSPTTSVSVGGYVDESDLADAYAEADLHVVALAEDATGTCVPSKVYAAMASGRGILYLGSARGQAAADVLRSGAGVVVPTDDRSELAAALDFLVADRARLATFGEASTRFFTEARTLRAGADEWIRVADTREISDGQRSVA